MRRPIIAGNWKMNMNIEETVKYIEEFKGLVKGAEAEVVLCVPYTSLDAAVKAAEGTNIGIGAENMHFEENGAFTGEISPSMLTSIGVKYVVIGHSERRQYFNETDEACNKKVIKAIEHGLTPLLCCGETLEERETNVTNEITAKQVKSAFFGVSAEDAAKVVVAYEPIWAIGTGKTATDEQANETIAAIRSALAGVYGEEVANKIRIQYGGSVKPTTIAAQMKQSDIDGALVGGASLVASDFAQIVNFNK